VASFPAARNRFFARSRPVGATAVTTPRANAAACGDTDDGRHRPTYPAAPRFFPVHDASRAEAPHRNMLKGEANPADLRRCVA
jgi:hypothetical protein